MRTTFHVVPASTWAAGIADSAYAAASLATEGFIHCTDGGAAMVAIANRFYADDPQPFVVLTVDVDALGVPWRYDEPGSPYPHVYGPIDRTAILAARPFPRDADGRFLPFEV